MQLTKRDKKDMLIIGICLLLLACFLYVSPVYSDSAGITRSSNFAVNPSDTFINLTFNSELWDTNNLHNNIVNPDRITIQTTGYYLLVTNFEYAYSTGTKYCGVKVNDINWIGYQYSTASSGFTPAMSVMYYLQKDDFVQIKVKQDGSTGTIYRNANYTPILSITSINQASGGSGEMTTEQYLSLFALIAFIAICVGIICGKHIWHFIGGDG